MDKRLPVADGGEGLVNVLMKGAGGQLETAEVTVRLMRIRRKRQLYQ